MKPKRTLGRREFLKNSTHALAVVSVLDRMLPAGAQAATPSPAAGSIPIRILGKTGLKLPMLGYGGAGLPKKWLNPLSREDRVALVRYAYDRGLRYFDTAGNYFESQAILGEALKDRRRDVCLVTKVETTQPEEVRKGVEKCLRELQTDDLDILLIHGTPGLEQMSVELRFYQFVRVARCVEKPPLDDTPENAPSAQPFNRKRVAIGRKG